MFMNTALVGNEACSVFHVSPLVLSLLEDLIPADPET